MIAKLKKIKNFIHSPWFKIVYKEYINPLNDVRQEKKPLNNIFLFEQVNLFLIIKPRKNDPSNEIIKLSSIIILKKVAK